MTLQVWGIQDLIRQATGLADVWSARMNGCLLVNHKRHESISLSWRSHWWDSETPWQQQSQGLILPVWTLPFCSWGWAGEGQSSQGSSHYQMEVCINFGTPNLQLSIWLSWEQYGERMDEKRSQLQVMGNICFKGKLFSSHGKQTKKN